MLLPTINNSVRKDQFMRLRKLHHHIALVIITLTLTLAILAVTAKMPSARAAINPNSTALQLVQAMTEDSSILTGATFVTKPPSGTPDAVSDTPLASFPTKGATYAILTTGDATLASTPNNAGNTGADLGGSTVRGTNDWDVTILKVDLSVPNGMNCLSFDFSFLTDEFPEYYPGSPFNDAFIAELDNSTWTTSLTSITTPNNFALDAQGKIISVGATSLSAANSAGTTYDGATPLLRATTSITPGAHSLYLSIFDGGDRQVDSAVFLDNLGLGTIQAGQCVVGARMTPPTTTATLAPAANGAGWNNSDVTVTLNATTSSGGGAVQSITYSATGAGPIASTTIPGAVASFTLSTEGQTTISFFAKDAGGNSEEPKTLTIKIDKTRPTVGCATADGGWKATDVSLSCAASDTGAGLVTASNASFSLTTSVPNGTETVSAATNSRQVCDLAGNCATAGPFTGLKVDKKAPAITLTTPTNGASYTLGQPITVGYSCQDGGAGVASCTGPVASGTQLDTSSVGSKTFTVTASDQVGNTQTLTVNYSVTSGGGTPATTCTHPLLGQLSQYQALGDKLGNPDANNGLAKLLDVSPPGDGTASGTYWRWMNYPKAVALQIDLGTPKTVSAIKLFTQTPTKAPNTYFQYSQNLSWWSDIPGLSNVNTGLSYGEKNYPTGDITARYFRLVIDNTTYLADLGYYSDLQLCISSRNGQPLGAPTGPQTKPASHRLSVMSASSTKGNASAVLDGLPWTSWLIDGKPASAELKLDLGKVQMVTGLRYFATYSAVARHTTVEYSANGASWTAFSGATNINTGGYGPNPSYGINTIGPFSPVAARYIRFRIDNPEGNWALGGYGEIDVVGYPQAAGPNLPDNTPQTVK
jgi:hypothetical protein